MTYSSAQYKRATYLLRLRDRCEGNLHEGLQAGARSSRVVCVAAEPWFELLKGVAVEVELALLDGKLEDVDAAAGAACIEDNGIAVAAAAAAAQEEECGDGDDSRLGG